MCIWKKVYQIDKSEECIKVFSLSSSSTNDNGWMIVVQWKGNGVAGLRFIFSNNGKVLKIRNSESVSHEIIKVFKIWSSGIFQFLKNLIKQFSTELMDSFLVSRHDRRHNRWFGDTIFKILCIFCLKMTKLSPPCLKPLSLFSPDTFGDKIFDSKSCLQRCLEKKETMVWEKVETVLSF